MFNLNHVSPFIKCKTLLFVILVLFISGCDDGDSSNQQDSYTSSQVSLNDGLRVLNEHQSKDTASYRIDINEQVYNPQNEQIVLDSVTPIEGQPNSCTAAVNNQDFSFNVSPDANQSCFYRFQVSGDSFEKSAVSQVILTTQEVEELPIVTEALVGQSEVTVDLSDQWFSSSVDFSTVSVKQLSDVIRFDGDSVEAIEVANDTIKFKATGNFGVSRFSYSLKNSSDEVVYIGYITITASTSVNNLPVANNFAVPANAKVGEKLTGISVSGHISDNDNDDLQLMAVYAFDQHVTVTLDDPSCQNEVLCNSFSFYTEKDGSYDITYVISDHHGGFATGIARVKTQSGLDPWSNINQVQDDIVFHPPWTVEKTLIMKGSYVGSFNENHDGYDYRMALFSSTLAESYCENQGMRLPTLSEITQLWNEQGDLALLPRDKDWVTEKNYWTSTKSATDNKPVTFNFTDGSNKEGDTEGLFTCVLDGRITDLVVDKNTKQIEWGTADFDLTAIVKSESGQGLNLMDVYFEAVPSEGVSFSGGQTVSTDIDGTAKSTMSVTKEGTYEVFATTLGTLKSVVVNTIKLLIGDFSRVVYNNELSNKVDVYTDIPAQLSVIVDEEGTPKDITNLMTWSVDKPSLVSINQATGVLTAIAPQGTPAGTVLGVVKVQGHSGSGESYIGTNELSFRLIYDPVTSVDFGAPADTHELNVPFDTPSITGTRSSGETFNVKLELGVEYDLSLVQPGVLWMPDRDTMECLKPNVVQMTQKWLSFSRFTVFVCDRSNEL